MELHYIELIKIQEYGWYFELAVNTGFTYVISTCQLDLEEVL